MVWRREAAAAAVFSCGVYGHLHRNVESVIPPMALLNIEQKFITAKRCETGETCHQERG